MRRLWQTARSAGRPATNVGGLKPEMVCGRIDDTVAAPLMLTLRINAGVAMLMVAVPT